MSISNLLLPNDLNLFCNSITAVSAIIPFTNVFNSIGLLNTTDQIISGANPNLTTSNYPASAGPVTLTFPNITTNIIGDNTVNYLTNKNLDDFSTDIVDFADHSKVLDFNLGFMSTAVNFTLIPLQTTTQIVNIPDVSVGDSLVTNNTIATLSNKKLEDSTTKIINFFDPTKIIKFDASAMFSGAALTITPLQSTTQFIEIPNVAALDAFVTNNTDAILSNKVFPSSMIFSSSNGGAVTVSHTIAIADLLKGIILLGVSAPAQGLTWDGAANIVAGVPNCQINSTFQVLIVNQSGQSWGLGAFLSGGTTQYSVNSVASGDQRILYFQVTNVLTPAVTVWG